MQNLKNLDCPNVVSDGRYLYSRNLVPGVAVYGERRMNLDGVEYRLWDPGRSKLAAYLMLSGRGCDLHKNDVVLYLGASTGTTVSHISDIVDKGRIFAIEISKKTFRTLMQNCAPRKNIIPMLGDARDEDLMEGILTGADYLYCDIAQPDQVGIFLSNFSQYNFRSGMLMLKCRSIDVASSPRSVLEEATSSIKERGYHVEMQVDISQYEKDHYALLVKSVDR
ncbi:MAG: fibrillarin-like rRNA/tRNA 2'-O-methyltransferase [Thermoplasmata archaeon]|nr:fibrillarin-like rRNA/tRNA 2'-O-methyltransferase [Thermoplasmata archaeon]